MAARQLRELFSTWRDKIDNQPGGARRRAAMHFQHLARVADHFFALIGVSQEVRHFSAKLGRGTYLNRTAFVDERSRQGREVFHVRPKQDRFSGQDCLGWILAALRD